MKMLLLRADKNISESSVILQQSVPGPGGGGRGEGGERREGGRREGGKGGKKHEYMRICINIFSREGGREIERERES